MEELRGSIKNSLIQTKYLKKKIVCFLTRSYALSVLYFGKVILGLSFYDQGISSNSGMIERFI